MKEIRTQIYLKANLKSHKFMYTGIEFYEFMQYLVKPIQNIMLLKGDFLGNYFQNNFELVEGDEYVRLLLEEDVYHYGDFCFMDYEKHGDVNQLTDEQIAEILFIAHMGRPLKSPFFDTIKNRFIYLAHDDGWFGKLYCREIEDFYDVIGGKIKSLFMKKLKNHIPDISAPVVSKIIESAENGILLDFDEAICTKRNMIVNVYCIGELQDMDMIYNYREKVKINASSQYQLVFDKNKWLFCNQ